jgi:hypothetical protein
MDELRRRAAVMRMQARIRELRAQVERHAREKDDGEDKGADDVEEEGYEGEEEEGWSHEVQEDWTDWAEDAAADPQLHYYARFHGPAS